MKFHQSPAAITLIYAALAGLWIVASGTLLAFSVEDPLLQSRIELAKGLAFVAVTSAFLYFALKSRQANPNADAADESQDAVADAVRRRTVPLLLALALTVPLIAFGVFTLSSRQQEQQVLNDLQAIANLKAEQTQAWLDERWGDANGLASESFSDRVAHMRRSGDTRESALVRKRLEALHQHFSYDSVRLLDPDAKEIFGVGRPLALSTQDAALLQKALATGKVIMGDILRDAAGNQHLNIFAPLQIADNERMQAVGAVVLHVDPARFLYPMIAGWPAASASGEVCLARREGESVVRLSPPRHAATTFNPRLTLTDTRRPAVAAVQSGKPGAQRAVDYRGVEVLAAWRPVAGTDWHILTKIDYHEAMTPARTLAAWAGLITLFAVAMVFAAVVALAREQQRAQRFALQLQSDRLLKQFYDLPFIGMAVTSPESKRWLNFNDQLCVIFGYTREELAQKTWAEMTHPEDLAKDVAEFERVMRGESDGYRLNKRFIRKDGTVVHTVIDIKCVLKPGGAVDYIVCMVQDVTETKTHEIALKRTAQMYDALSRTNSAIVKCTSETDLFAAICSAAVESGAIKFAFIGMLDNDSGAVRPVANHGEGAAYLDGIKITVDADDPHGRGPTGTAIRENRAYWCQDFHNDPNTVPWHRRGAAVGWAASAALPLRRDGIAVGALTLYAAEVNAFDAQTQALLLEMAQDVSYALDAFDREKRRRKIEQEHTAQLEELRRWNTATLSREERIIELKQEVNALLERSGKSPRYASADTNNKESTGT
jgi:PAS domain S-box-containing protein